MPDESDLGDFDLGSVAVVAGALVFGALAGILATRRVIQRPEETKKMKDEEVVAAVCEIILNTYDYIVLQTSVTVTKSLGHVP